jgi:hypothetical protein
MHTQGYGDCGLSREIGGCHWLRSSNELAPRQQNGLVLFAQIGYHHERLAVPKFLVKDNDQHTLFNAILYSNYTVQVHTEHYVLFLHVGPGYLRVYICLLSLVTFCCTSQSHKALFFFYARGVPHGRMINQKATDETKSH